MQFTGSTALAVEIAARDKRIAELEAKIATQEKLVLIYQAIGRQELGDELFEETVRGRIADLERAYPEEPCG